MPITRIETRKGWIADKKALFEAVQAALVEGTRENWGLQGKPASEIELGFKVEV